MYVEYNIGNHSLNRNTRIELAVYEIGITKIDGVHKARQCGGVNVNSDGRVYCILDGSEYSPRR